MDNFKDINNEEKINKKQKTTNINEKGKMNKKGKRLQNGNNKKRVLNKKKLIIFAIIAITIILVSTVLLKLTDYIILDKNISTNLVINNNNITSNVKNEIIIEDNNIYISKQDIANFFDEHIYEVPDSDIVVTTYDKKIAELSLNENEMKVNDSNVKLYAEMFEKDDVIYLPISEMEDIYNIEIEYIQETNIITMDSLDREQKQAIVKTDIPVKSSTNFISKTLDRVEKGESVVIISKGENHTKVRTPDGKIGYVKTNKLENEFIVREEYIEEKQIEGKINLTWEYFSEFGSAPDMEEQEIPGLNVVSPAFFYLDSDGELKQNVGQSGMDYINWAESNEYKVWAMVGNAEAGISVTSEVMNSYESRKELINKLVDVAVEYKLDGLNIDFEYMKEEDKDLYSRFIIELTPRLKEFGMVVSVDVTAPDGAPEWSLCFDRHVLGQVADYLIFMAYDQNGVSSKEPGTTAGYDWVKSSLEKFLGREEVPSEKLILAVPFYTRVWTTNSNGELISNSTVSVKNIDTVIPEEAERIWDENLKQYYTKYEVDGNIKEVWIEDLESLKAKISLINENELAGVASWVRGMETQDVWEMFQEELGL